MKFLRNLLAAILGCLIAFGIFFFMVFAFAALVGNMDDGIVVKPKSVLKLSFTKPVRDYAGSSDDSPFGALFQEEVGLDKIVHAIRVAKGDDKIKGISLTTSFLFAGLAQTQEIRKALLDFKSEGKFIYSHSDFYSQKDYYLASVADQLYLNPVGAMDFKGLATEVLYYKDLQEKTGLKMEVIRHGKYKSAVEPYLSDTMSDENRTQLSELIKSIWEAMLVDISSSRNISVANLNAIADTLGGRNPEYAIKSNLIDASLYVDEYEQMLKGQLGVAEDEDIEYVSFWDYVEVASAKTLQKGKDKIAVIYAEGEILYGEGGKEFLGQGAINKALKKAREDEKVKAIVMRVNSPGGSALVSDIIWREVLRTKELKPLVVSFGDVAASGGYYIGVAGDKIFAEPTTITGSIGVFGTIPNANELAETVGINAEQVGTNANSVDYSLFEPMTNSFRATIKEGIEETYTTFLERVAEGRNMTTEQVDAIAQGRVWSGVEAKDLGLIDELGSLEDAIAAAAEMADMEAYGIRKYPKYKSDFERLMEDFGGVKAKLGEAVVKDQIGEQAFRILTEVKHLNKQSGIQARMPYTINIQ